MEDLKRQAYKNLHELVLYSDESFIGSPLLLLTPKAEMLNSLTGGQQNINTSTADEGTQDRQGLLSYFKFKFCNFYLINCPFLLSEFLYNIYYLCKDIHSPSEKHKNK